MTENRPEVLDGQSTIAIIGVGAKMPGALSAPKFWDNIQNGVYAISDVPLDRWDPDLYWDPDPNAEDKTYSKIGGWVTGFEFDRRAFRMPPTVVEKVDPTQLLCLEATREALDDAGYLDRDFDRDRTAVILGNALGGDLRDRTNLRIQYAELNRALRQSLLEASTGRLSEDEIETLLTSVEQKVKSDIIGINEDSMPGELANIIAGRVAQSFDLRGPNYVCDAACASTLAALESAVHGLRAGQFDMVVAGGADRSMGPPSYVKFSKIGALSPDGSRPFDADANGFVMGEGAGIVILKRLSDAIEAGDKIYALIRGIGGASDGRGKGITAPNPRGQEHAVRRAYTDAGVTPKTVSLIEAHGTSTPVGDPAEVQSLRTVFNEDDTPIEVGAIGLGSVKSMVGHLKSAAAAASLIKVAYALHDKVLPPTINVETPNPRLELEGSPFRLQTETAEWSAPARAPRRAGISAFGFGGTNFHVVLEEYDPEGSTGTSKSWSGTNFTGSKGNDMAMATSSLERGILGFAASTVSELQQQFADFKAAYERDGLAVVAPHCIPLTGSGSTPHGQKRLCIAYTSADELTTRLGRTEKAFDRGKGWNVLANQGIFLTEGALEGDIAMLFPGQGTQYLGMLADLREHFPTIEATLQEADDIMTPILGEPLTGILYPDNGSDEDEAFSKLTQTEITQPAVLTADIAILRTLQALGIQPAMVAGHSLGEYGACVAAGVMTFEEALRTVARRGTAMAAATPMNGDPGLMAGVPLSAEEVQKTLDQVEGYVVCANKNCSKQTIIAGLTEAVQEAIAKFEEAGHSVVILPVSHAFHSKVVAAASEPLRQHLSTIDIQPPHTRILTNVTGDFYPQGEGVEDQIRDLLSKQVAAPVEFIALVEKMYASGARVFVEVGPKRAQTSFVSDILEGRPHAAMYTNHPKKGDVGSLFEALAQLWAVGAWDVPNTPVDGPQDDTNSKDNPAARSTATTSTLGVHRAEALDLMVQVLCDKTGYDPAEIETDFELEADLGVDTVKQAEIMAAVREHYGFAKDDNFRLSEYPTLDALADYILETMGDAADAPVVPATAVATPDVPAPATHAANTTSAGVDRSEALELMVQVLCEKTGYDAAEIETDFELEADLGVDTVKQAEIMAAVREHYGFAKDEEFRLSEYPTLDALADYIVETMGGALAPAEAPVAPVPEVTQAATAPALEAPSTGIDRSEALDLMVQVLCEKTGYDPAEIETDFELEADLGVDTVKQAEIMAAVREHYGFAKDDEFRLSEYPTLDALADYITAQLGSAPASAATAAESKPAARIPAPTETIRLDAQSTRAAKAAKRATPAKTARPESERNWEHPHAIDADIVVSGAALGLPGLAEVFAEDTVEALLSGKNMIGDIKDRDRKAMATKRITRLLKHESGGGEMVPVDDIADVLKLAGMPGSFDLGDWDIPDRVVQAMDETSRMAFAAGLLALRDAGIPLIPRYRETTTGKKLTIGWTLPESIANDTGVIFATAFAGQDALIEELTKAHTDPDYEFDHRYLLKVLGIGNSRFAEFIGARGPNSKINNACASTTTAIALAQDWIAVGRCKRVIIIGADNASGDQMIQWIGSGFLATGAATTEGDVANAALPFDKRRNGIIMGMGAVAMVVEQAGLPEARGIEPIADVLATRIANSAQHPTRLDADHIADEVGQLISQAESKFGIAREEFASKTVFVSHETYSPARGGSAQTEIESLRRTFGEHANEVVIANTKGFTGHAMGAGIEDILALKALQREQLPHIANFQEPDPELGDLRLSQGGEYKLDYALRLAAGFGSQLALALLRFRARTEDRVASPERYDAWLREVSGFESPDLAVEHRTLRLTEGTPKQTQPVEEKQTTVETPAPIAATEGPSDVRRTPARASSEPREPVDAGNFEQLGVVVEAHAAANYELAALREELRGKRVAIIAGPLVVTELMMRALGRCKADVVVLESSDSRNPLNDDFVACDLTDEDAIIRELNAFGSIDGVVNLLGFGADKFGSKDVYRAARYSFHVARAWRRTLERAPNADEFFVTITGMGGRLGFDRATGPLPVCGAVAGFTKALAREWTDARIRVIDVARRGIDPNLGLQVFHEALFGTGAEVGLIHGVRYVPATVRADEITPQTLPSLAPDADDVLVVTGGAKGITAEVALDLAARYGSKLALVGRTRMTHADPLSVDMSAEKSRVRDELSAQGERVTPIMVRDELRSLESQRTIAANMERMRAAGSEVEYFACDVSNETSVAAMIDQVISRFGRLDGIIHGAGVEESQLIEDKDVAGFDRVFRGKALGALHLWTAAKRHNPTFYMAFSSVAGRFGNPGQVDYAAANEVLNKLVALLNATSDVRATSIDWTAWDEVGMAADGGMRTLLEARGVELLPPSIGAPMVGDFLEAGMAGEFVVAGNLGDFAQDVAEPSKPSSAAHGPLITEVVEQTDDRVVVARTFDIGQDHFLRDHVYEGNPVVPGVMGFEMMTEAAQLLVDEPAVVLRGVSFEHAIKLHRNEPVRLVATAERNGRAVEVAVRTHRVTKTGREIETVHYRGTVHFGDTATSESFVLDPASRLLEGPKRDLIYTRYFHEGTFQVLDEVPWIGPDFVIGYGRLPRGVLTAGHQNTAFVTDPMVREMAFQVAGLWGMATQEMSYLPYSIDRAEHFASARPEETVCVRCRKREDADDHMIAFDVEALGADGRLLQRMERVQLVGHRKLTEEEQFPAFPQHTFRTRRLDKASAEAVLRARGLSFDDLVDAEERKAYDRLISQRRKGEWIAARVAMKTLVSDFVRDFYAQALSPAQVRIRKDDRKAPFIVLEGATTPQLPAISISHSGGTSVASITCCRDQRAVGIDLETIEERDESFARNYFSPEELALLPSVKSSILQALLWSAKEAVSKALGIGLEARLDEIEIRSVEGEGRTWTAQVALSGVAAAAAERLGASDLRVTLVAEAEKVFATAITDLDQTVRATADLPAFEREETPAPEPLTDDYHEQFELAAIAALLKHRGLVERRGGTGLGNEPSEGRDLSSWKR